MHAGYGHRPPVTAMPGRRDVPGCFFLPAGLVAFRKDDTTCLPSSLCLRTATDFPWVDWATGLSVSGARGGGGALMLNALRGGGYLWHAGAGGSLMGGWLLRRFVEGVHIRFFSVLLRVLLVALVRRGRVCSPSATPVFDPKDFRRIFFFLSKSEKEYGHKKKFFFSLFTLCVTGSWASAVSIIGFTRRTPALLYTTCFGF